MEKLVLWIGRNPGTFVALAGGCLAGMLGAVIDGALETREANAAAAKAASEALGG